MLDKAGIHSTYKELLTTMAAPSKGLKSVFRLIMERSKPCDPGPLVTGDGKEAEWTATGNMVQQAAIPGPQIKSSVLAGCTHLPW